MVECIIKGQRPLIRPEHAYHVLEIMEKAREEMLTKMKWFRDEVLARPDGPDVAAFFDAACSRGAFGESA